MILLLFINNFPVHAIEVLSGIDISAIEQVLVKTNSSQEAVL